MFQRPARRAPTPRRRVPPGKAKTRVDRHPFALDATVPPDHRGRDTCRTCHCIGKAGDARHVNAGDELPPVDPAVREAEQRRYGETGDDD